MGREAAGPETEPKRDVAAAVRIDGDLTVWRIGELHQTVTAALAPGNGAVLDLAEVVAADVAGLQLLCAAHRSASDGGQALRILAGPAVAEAIDRAGLRRHAGCRDGCLWAGGT